MRDYLPIINSQDITVVVQGPIIGKPDDSFEEKHTQICLQSIRKYLPKAEIVLSTWEGSDVRGLDYDVLIENKDPGKSMMGDFSINCFRQIVSSINGLKNAILNMLLK